MLKAFKKILVKYRLVIIPALFATTFVISFSLSSNLSIIYLSSVWIIFGYFYKFNERIYFGIVIFYLLLGLFFFLFKDLSSSERMTIWEFIFLIIGTVWGFILTFKNEK